MFQSIVSKFNTILLFGVFGIALFLIELYVWQGLKTLARDWTQRNRNILFYGYWIVGIFYVCLTLFKPFIHLGREGNPIFGVIQALGFGFIIALVFFIIPLLLEDIFRFFEWVVGLFAHKDSEHIFSSRRKFISIAGVGIGSLPFIGMTYGIARGAHNYKVKNVNLSFKELPKSFDGIKIMQISDIHSGSFWSENAVKRGVKKINDLNADLVLFTGDLVNSYADEMLKWKDLFATITAPMGVFSVLGNHDYGDYVHWGSNEDKIANLEKLQKIQLEMGWKLLNNQSFEITKEGESIEIIGVENWSAKANFPKYGDLSKAVSGSKGLPFQILLSHDPSHWRAQVLGNYKNIKLTLSGHTHGFQFGIETHNFKWSPIKYMYKEWAGIYEENGQFLYVNRGFGYLGYPGRIGINPEITLITLHTD